MKGPFKFSASISEQERYRRRILYSVTALVLTVMFTVGFITVYVNSYNIMHSEPMKIFGFYRTDNEIGFVLFNRFFELF